MCPALHLLTVINHLSNATAAKIIRLDGSKSSRLLNDDSRVLNALSLGKPSLKKNKKKMTFVISGLGPKVTKGSKLIKKLIINQFH